MKVLTKAIATAVVSISLLSCEASTRAANTTSETDVRVTYVSSASYKGSFGDALESACANWRLSAQQVERFFQLSERYDEPQYRSFYQIPCSISGKLDAEGKSWDFVIGGGATATWTDGKEIRHWGCAAKACLPLALMPYDGMNPAQTGSNQQGARLALKKWGLAYCIGKYLPAAVDDAAKAQGAYFQAGGHSDEQAYQSVRNFFDEQIRRDTSVSSIDGKPIIVAKCLDIYESEAYRFLLKQQDKHLDE